MKTGFVLNEIYNERLRQETKWGQQNHVVERYYTILAEEFGEVGKAIIEYFVNGKPLQDIRTELIHTAAVAVAMIECLDRNGK